MKVKIKDSHFRLAMFLLAVWYVFLCVLHYLSLQPLSNDEQCVFNNIQAFSPYQIFHERLLNVQVFPRLYLFFIQSFSKNFDFHWLSLRFLPFVFMLGAFALWLCIAKYEFKNKLDYLVFMLCWPASVILVYYSAGLKQYSFDVFAAALFILFLYNQQTLALHKFRLYIFLLLVFPFLGLMSYPALLMMFLPLINLFISVLKNEKESRKYFGIYAAGMTITLIVSYIFDMRLREVAVVTTGFGDYFVSTANPAEFFKTAGEGIVNLFSRWLAESPRLLKRISCFFFIFGLIYMFYGFFKNIKSEKGLRSLNTIALVIFIGLFLLGLAKKYPFTVPRTSLFFCPVVMALTIKGIGLLRSWNQYVYYGVYAAFIVFLLYVSSGIANVLFHGDLSAASTIWP